MSHLLTKVNGNVPDVNGAILSGVTSTQYLLIGANWAMDFSYLIPPANNYADPYPRAFAVGDEHLFRYVSGSYINTIAGATINNYTTNYAKSFTLPEGSYVAGFNTAPIEATSPPSGNMGTRCSLTDGTTVYSSQHSHGRNTYASYNSSKRHVKTRFTLSSSTTLYVRIDVEIQNMKHDPFNSGASLYFIKEN